MSTLVETLRANAKAAPLWAAVFESAADEIERLKERIDTLEGGYKNEKPAATGPSDTVKAYAYLSDTVNRALRAGKGVKNKTEDVRPRS